MNMTNNPVSGKDNKVCSKPHLETVLEDIQIRINKRKYCGFKGSKFSELKSQCGLKI